MAQRRLGLASVRPACDGRSRLELSVLSLLGVKARHCRLVLALCLILLMGFQRVAGAAAEDHVTEDGWVRLGPDWLPRVDAVAVALDWPSDRFMLAADQEGFTRSRDGGETWERIPRRGGMGELRIARGQAGARIVFGGSISGRLYRSVDEAVTWDLVLEKRSHGAAFTLRPSPSLERDGLAFAVGEGKLYRSKDWGATWDPLDPAGQRVQQLEFSPDFERDGTIFVSVVSEDFSVPFGSGSTPEWTEGNAKSIGMMVSMDGGDSWTATSSGLEIAGVPYRAIVRLAVSPAFAQDGTLVALAWGPVWDVANDPRRSHSRFAITFGLFRSTDRGASWTPVWRGSFSAAGSPDPHLTGPFRRAAIVLSPQFDVDGVGLLLATTGLGYGPSSGCEIYRTSDHGSSWALIPTGGAMYPSLQSDSSCGRVWLTASASGINAVGWRRVDARSHEINWFSSRDAGLTWTVEPRSGPFTAQPGAVGSAVDGTVFLGGQNGIWALGPSAQPANAGP